MEPADFADFLNAIREVADRYGMALSRPLALVSGGPDSVALLRVLLELRAEPVVLHVDYGLRGAESRRDAKFVQRLCEELELPCEVRRIELQDGNLQEKARKERYRLAAELAEEHERSCIATGHTADDVAETVLLNLARGAGLRGLSGIPPVRGRVARPLIRTRRQQILRYLDRLGQPYRTDLTNLMGKYSRNRVRLEVMPVLEELYPGAVGNIAHGAELLREDLAVLEGLIEGAVRYHGEEVVVPLDELEKMPYALRRHAVRRAFSLVASGRGNLRRADLESVLTLALRREGTRVLDLPGGVTCAARFGETLAFYRRTEPPPGEMDLPVGTRSFDRWVVEVSEVQKFDDKDAARPEVAYLNADRGPYRVRLAREGDTIRPLGLGGTKKVLRAMMDRKVPKDLRRRTPVVVGARGRIAWIYMGELDKDFGIAKTTDRILRVEVKRAP